MKHLISLFIILITLNIYAQTGLERVEPPMWWAGMKSPDLQLMIYGENISTTDVFIEYPGVKVESVTKVKSPNYLFVDFQV